MRWHPFMLGAVLASPTVAAPSFGQGAGQSSNKAVLSRLSCKLGDICLRAAILAQGPPRKFASAAASSNCAGFVTKTVTPCPVTTTSTIFSTVDALPSTQIVEVTAISISTNVDLVTSTSVQSFTESITVTSEQVIVSTATQVSTSTVVVTSVSGSNYVQKRELAVEHELDKRATITPQCPVTSSATAIPGLWSTCGNTSRYSSACSCFGVPPGVKTLPAQTVAAVATVISTNTPTVTVFLTTTIQQESLTTSTSVQQASTTTTSTFTDVVTISSVTQTTVTTTSTASTVILPPFPTTFVIKTGGSSAMYGALGEEFGDEAVGLGLRNIPSLSAQLWSLAFGNQLFTADQTRNVWCPPFSGPIEVIPPSDIADQQFYRLMQASMGAYDNATQGYALTFNNPPTFLQMDSLNNLFFYYRQGIQGFTDPPALFAVPPGS